MTFWRPQLGLSESQVRRLRAEHGSGRAPECRASLNTGMPWSGSGSAEAPTPAASGPLSRPLPSPRPAHDSAMASPCHKRRPISTKQIRALVQRVMAAAGLNPLNFGAHSLRLQPF